MLDDAGSRGEFLRLLAEFGEEPAFIRRASAMQQQWKQFLKRCRKAQSELIKWPRIHFFYLKESVTGDWTKLRRSLRDPGAFAFYEHFESTWGITQQYNIQRPRKVSSALRQFTESANRFDRRWTEYIEQVDLETLNRVRRDYNEYYPIERACAFGSELDGKEFEPVPMVDRAELRETFPLINAPNLR